MFVEMITTNVKTEGAARVGNVMINPSIPSEQAEWLTKTAKEIGEKPSFIIRDLIRQAMAGIVTIGASINLQQQAN